MLSSMHTPTVFKHCLLNQKHTVILSSRNSVRFKVTDSWQYRVDRRSLQCTFSPLATDRHSESKTPRVFHRPWKYLPLSLFVTLTLAFSPSHSIPHTVTSSLSFSFSFFPPALSLCYFSSSLVIISHHHPAVIIFGCAVAITVCFSACTVCIHQVCCSSKRRSWLCRILTVCLRYCAYVDKLSCGESIPIRCVLTKSTRYGKQTKGSIFMHAS